MSNRSLFVPRRPPRLRHLESWAPTETAAANPQLRWLVPRVLALVALAGCASLPPVGDPQNAFAAPPLPANQIHWPEKYKPEDAGFFVHNEIEILAPPEAVWSVLVEAENWPSWYEGAQTVKVNEPLGRGLGPHSAFTWTTMGLDFTSIVKEFAPPFRLSWESRKSTIKGYHGWLVIPTGAGCRLVTEESQHGFLTLMQKIFVPKKLHRLHDVWLAGIKKRAESETRPSRTTAKRAE